MSIRRIGEERSHTTFSESLEVFIVGRWTIRKGGFIELPVTRMDESTDRSLDEESYRIRDGVIDDEWCDLEMLPDLDRLIASVFAKIRESGSHVSLLELDEFIGHGCGIEWGIPSELFHEIVDSSDMVDMTVSDTGTDDLLPTTVGEIRNS